MSPAENLPQVVVHAAFRGSSIPDAESIADSISLALRLILDEFGRGVDPSRAELSIVLADDAEIRRLNRKHRSIDGPTDTLSFPVLDPGDMGKADSQDGQPLVLGDVVLGIETIARQADERGKGFPERFAECLVHGILHLLGWDHETETGRKKMESVEDSLVPQVMAIMDQIEWDAMFDGSGRDK